MSSGTGIAMGHATSNPVSRRRLRRYAIAVPIDVVALRSGVPASIPGRTLDVSEGGVATVLAGELSPGEPVGVEFRLPAAREAIQAKAIVRHSSLMRCGLQFLAMSIEQENALRSWTEMADRAAVRTTTSVASRAASATPAAGSVRNAKPVKRSHGLRWAVMSAGVVAVVLAAVAWWSWNTGWRELENDGTGNAAAVPFDVSSSVMGQRIIHRVDPIYPSDALKAKIQGQVTLEALISEDGTVRDVYAVSGPEALRSAASDAVKWWRFEPYRVNGRAAAVHTLIEVDFRLER
ncbi:MAG TPA: TonB family protein [Terriglobales bacterium]